MPTLGGHCFQTQHPALHVRELRGEARGMRRASAQDWRVGRACGHGRHICFMPDACEHLLEAHLTS